MKTIRSLIPLLFLLVSCATVGQQFDTTHVHDVKGGQNKSQITGWFGEPTQKTTFTPNDKGCVERWQYTHATSQAFGSTHSQVLIVDFDDKGVVCDTAYSEVNQ